jgi:hypothetical protein
VAVLKTWVVCECFAARGDDIVSVCFAAVYSLEPLSMKAKAATWHYWRMPGGIAVSWVCFYLFAVCFFRGSKPTTVLTGVLLAQAVSVPFAQVIFVVDLTLATVWLRRSA